MAKKVYFPTVEACWDYGIARNGSLLPIIGSLLPYSFLRGVQFDTKLFKLWEIGDSLYETIGSEVGKGNGAFNASKARNEIILIKNNPERLKKISENKAKGATITNKKTNTDGGITVEIKAPESTKDADQSAAQEEEDSLHIAVDNDSNLEFSIQNKWGSGEDIITRILQGGAEIVKNIGEIVRTGSNVIRGEDNFSIVPFNPRRYQGSEFGDLSISFTLFTKNDFIRDIYKPLLLLKTYSVPSKLEGMQAETLLDVFTQAVGEAVPLTKNIGKNETVQTVEKIGKQELNKRLHVVAPPPTFSIQHSSGMFFMENAGIESFTFKPEGPWIRAEYDGLLGKTLGKAKNVGAALDRLLQDVYIKFPSYPKECYPSRVKCTIKFKELAFITQESFKRQEEKKAGVKLNVIFDSLKPEGEMAAMIAGGIAQNMSTVIPDIKGAGDLLSGGKWVPPGESLTGVPGFL